MKFHDGTPFTADDVVFSVNRAKSPVSTRMIKHTLNVIENMSLRDGYRYEQDMTGQIGQTEDAREAQRSYEANLKMFDQIRQMSSSLLDLLRK